MQDLILYTEDAPKLPSDRVEGWLLIARGKAKMDNILEGHKLMIEKLIKDVKSNDKLRSLESEIAEYRKIQSAMVTDRKLFTGILDYVKDNCMIIEKEFDPKTNADLGSMEAFHLTWKRKKADEQQQEENKQREIISLRTHVVNQYQLQISRFKQDLRALIHECYTHCLKAKTPASEVKLAMEICAKAMLETNPITLQPFPTTILTKEEKQQIAGAVERPNFKVLYDELFQELSDTFDMYANDLAAADVVLQQAKINYEHAKIVDNQALENQVATNTLIAQGSIYIADKVEIKSKTEIQMVDDDPAFVMKIMSAFISNFQKCMPLLTVKKYSGLTIKQMATALDKAQIQVVGVDYITTEK